MIPALITYDIGGIAQRDFVAFLDNRPDVLNWFTPFMGTFLVVVRQASDPVTLSEGIRIAFPNLTFCVSPVNVSSADGWMPRQFWELVQRPIPSAKRASAELKPVDLVGALKKQDPVRAVYGLAKVPDIKK